MNFNLTKSVRIVFSHINDGIISEEVPYYDSASYSGLLSMAGYLCHHYPELNPPYCPVAQNNHKDVEQFPSPQLTYNKYL